MLGCLWLLGWLVWLPILAAMVKRGYPLRLVRWLRSLRRGAPVAVLLLLAGGAARADGALTSVSITAYSQSSNSVAITCVATNTGTYNPYCMRYTDLASGAFHDTVAYFNNSLSGSQSITFPITAPAPGAFDYKWELISYGPSGYIVGGTVYQQANFSWANASLGTSSGGLYTPLATTYNALPLPSSPSMPGDLTIGIPQLGDVSLPASWFTSILSYAQQFESLQTGMSASGLGSAFADVQKQLGMTEDNLITNFQAMQTTLFVPQQSDQQQLQAQLSNFTNWGPYTYGQSVVAAFQPAGLGTTTPAAPNTSALSSLGMTLPMIAHPGDSVTVQSRSSVRPSLAQVAAHVRAVRAGLAPRDSGTSDVDEITSGTVGLPVMSVALAPGYVVGTDGTVQAVQAGQWYDSGQRVPFDFTPITNSPAWAVFRGLLGAMVYVLFAWGTFLRLMPKQEF